MVSITAKPLYIENSLGEVYTNPLAVSAAININIAIDIAIDLAIDAADGQIDMNGTDFFFSGLSGAATAAVPGSGAWAIVGKAVISGTLSATKEQVQSGQSWNWGEFATTAVLSSTLDGASRGINKNFLLKGKGGINAFNGSLSRNLGGAKIYNTIAERATRKGFKTISGNAFNFNAPAYPGDPNFSRGSDDGSGGTLPSGNGEGNSGGSGSKDAIPGPYDPNAPSGPSSKPSPTKGGTVTHGDPVVTHEPTETVVDGDCASGFSRCIPHPGRRPSAYHFSAPGY